MRVARVYVFGAFRPALLGERGHKFTQIVIQHDSGLRSIKLKNREADKAPDILYRGSPYPVKRAKKLMRGVASKRGATKSAMSILRAA